MRARIFALLCLAVCCVAAAADARPSKLPSAYEGRVETSLYNGKQRMPFILYGVARNWDKACLKGKAAECLRLADAFETGARDLRADIRVSIAYLIKACQVGSGPGCARAAAILRNGKAGFTNLELAGQMAERGCNVLKDQASCSALAVSMAASPAADPRKAAALIDTACASGDSDGCRLKASALFYDRGDAGSRAKAIRMFEAACEQRRAWGCLGLAEAYGKGLGVTADPVRTARYAAEGCTNGQGDRLRLCTLHGSALISAGDRASLNSGEKFLDASCKGGDGLACNRLGLIGLGGKAGATTTRGEGLYYLRRGCDLDYGEACANLSTAYKMGVEVDPDTAVVLALLDKACRLKHGVSCSTAQALVTRNPDLRLHIPAIDPSLPVGEQLARARKAVASGDRAAGLATTVRLMYETNEDAEWQLGGWMYYGLPGVFDTPRKADGLILIENAARVGHVDAAIFMGMAYWYGQGVEENRSKGENYMAIAASRGDEKAAAILRSMKAEPVRQDFAHRQKAMEEAARTQRVTWANEFAAANAGRRFGSSYSPGSSPVASVSSMMDNLNWNHRIDYLSGRTSVCRSSNPYC
ncbi:MAG: SEL1-like repeat protein [Caulobacter sp.]|nr:SEL1-like repeat protein [Caulobacter sp.]